MANRQFCTFLLANYYFGVDVCNVQEVIRFQELTPVPLASELVRGLINLRGQIVTGIDLRSCLHLPARGGEKPPMNVVVRTDDGPVSCLVDEIGDVLEVSDELFEEPPETIDGIARELILGAYKLEGRLLMILDVEKAICQGV